MFLAVFLASLLPRFLSRFLRSLLSTFLSPFRRLFCRVFSDFLSTFCRLFSQGFCRVLCSVCRASFYVFLEAQKLKSYGRPTRLTLFASVVYLLLKLDLTSKSLSHFPLLYAIMRGSLYLSLSKVRFCIKCQSHRIDAMTEKMVFSNNTSTTYPRILQ